MNNNNNNFQSNMSEQSPNVSMQGANEVQTDNQTLNEEWLTVEEAYDYLLKNGLQRSTKTIRARCRNRGFGQTRKQTTANGYRHQVSKNSLDVYIQAERELSVPHKVHVNLSGQVSKPTTEQVQNTSAQEKEPEAEKGELEKLREQVKQLEADKVKLEADMVNLKIEKEVAYRTRDYVQTIADKIYDDSKCADREHTQALSNAKYELGEARAKLGLPSPPEHRREGDNATQNTPQYEVQ